MKHKPVLRYVVPFIQWYALMILITIGIDYMLHYYQLAGVGRYLGYLGTFLLVFSFVYSLRKRKMIKSGSPKKLLIMHEYMAWVGSIMLLVHAGIHFNAILPWLAVTMLLISVASGLVGKFLLKRSFERLNASRQALMETGLEKEAVDKKLFFDSIMVDAMKQWRTIHLPIALVFGLFSLLHIITVFMFSK
ncbi:MAG: hypothetical protein IPJ06_05720 [Saprospiraceae bacterium]|nr:hypothetical protein [Saprospiraceae bacterium]